MKLGLLAGAGALVVYLISRSQRARLRKPSKCRAAAADQDEYGARTHVIPGKFGLEFYVRRWEPASTSEINSVLIMTHGFMLHSAFFDEAAKLFTAQGVAVISYDFYGHGVSGSLGGVQGFHANLQDWIDQASKVIELAKTEWHPGLPVFLYSDSFGGVVNLTMCGQQKQIQEQLAGLIVAGAPLKLVSEMLPPAPVLAFMKFLAKCFPLLPLPDPTATDPDHFASAFGDKAWADRIWNDPLVVRAVRMGMLPVMLNSFAGVKQLYGKIRRVPVLVMHGKNDTRCLYEGSMDLFDKLGGSRKVLKLYDGMQHQLMHGKQADVEQVAGDMLEWMQRLR